MSVTQSVTRQVKLITENIRTLSTQSNSQLLTLYHVLRIIILVAVYYGYEYWSRHWTRLPLTSYMQPVLAVELVKHALAGAIPLFGLAMLIGGGVIGRRRVLNPWAVFQHGRHLRLLVGSVAFITAWTYSTYAYNFYFDQGHYLDRLLLIALMVCIWWRPVFVLPFTALLMTIIGQFNYPLTDQDSLRASLILLVHALQLFSVFVVFYVVTGTSHTDDFIFVLGCMIAAGYVRSGVGKLQLGWLSLPNLHLFVLGGYANGWLSFLQPEQVIAVARFLSPFSLPMMIGTLVVELGALIYMASRRLMMGFLAVFAAFHTGIFVLSGLFFWHWIFLEMMLLIFLYRTRREPLNLHTRRHVLLSVVLIGTGFIWLRSVNLAWYDTPLHYSYRYEGITASGQSVLLPNNLFAPYTDLFTFQNFSFLHGESQLTGPYGVTMDRAVAEDVLQAHQPEEVFALEQKYPPNPLDVMHTDQFVELITYFIRNLNNHRHQNLSWWSALHPPGEMVGFPRAGAHWDQSSPIEKVIMYQYTSLFDGENYFDIRQRIVLEVTDLGEAAAAG